MMAMGQYRVLLASQMVAAVVNPTPTPPAGAVFRVDENGNYLMDENGNYQVEPTG